MNIALIPLIMYSFDITSVVVLIFYLVNVGSRVLMIWNELI